MAQDVVLLIKISQNRIFLLIYGDAVDLYVALLHKDFKDRAFLSCLNLSDNLGVRSAELRKLI
ncbi:hypothetical protein CTZ23_02210 [Acinetobacter indicus]|nr:hypothetical protein CTZ23_02210 [Acinetobacter indicus]